MTLEANPGTLTPEKLEIYRQAGVNRLSMGVQSFDDGLGKPWAASIPPARRKRPFHGPGGGV